MDNAATQGAAERGTAGASGEPDNAAAPSRRLPRIAAAVALALVAPGWALAADTGTDDGWMRAFALRADNDVFAGRDRGYTNGTSVAFVSKDLEGFQDERLPGFLRWVNRRLTWLQPEGAEQSNLTVTIDHGLFTPTDRLATVVIPDDRPYAGVLLLGATYGTRNGDTLTSTTFNLGLVGPGARGEQVQNAAHHLFGSHRFYGWENQLGNEVLVRVLYQRYRRYAHEGSDGGWGTDLIVHGGGSLGNLATYANAGAEFRFGPSLPDNFGTAPSLSGAEDSAPLRGGSSGWHAHGFLALDVRAVAYDITLDGNTFKDSHSVDRKPVVSTLGAGVALQSRKWKIAFTRFYGTREFYSQDEPPQLGSITVRYEL